MICNVLLQLVLTASLSSRYGKILLVRHRSSSRLFAMKVLRKATIVLHIKGREQMKAERTILEDVQYPFIVQLYWAFQTEQRLYLILEYAVGGELYHHLANERMFPESTVRFYAAQIFLALNHLHKLGIIYRDLKPENCLLNEQGYLLLTDFGLSKLALSGENTTTKTICGTIEYMAPEILLGNAYSYSVDWWSFGILLFDMLCGSPPFGGNNRKKTEENILSKKLKIPRWLGPDVKDLIIRVSRSWTL